MRTIADSTKPSRHVLVGTFGKCEAELAAWRIVQDNARGTFERERWRDLDKEEQYGFRLLIEWGWLEVTSAPDTIPVQLRATPDFWERVSERHPEKVKS